MEDLRRTKRPLVEPRDRYLSACVEEEERRKKRKLARFHKSTGNKVILQKPKIKILSPSSYKKEKPGFKVTESFSNSKIDESKDCSIIDPVIIGGCILKLGNRVQLSNENYEYYKKLEQERIKMQKATLEAEKAKKEAEKMKSEFLIMQKLCRDQYSYLLEQYNIMILEKQRREAIPPYSFEIAD